MGHRGVEDAVTGRQLLARETVWLSAEARRKLEPSLSVLVVPAHMILLRVKARIL